MSSLWLICAAVAVLLHVVFVLLRRRAESSRSIGFIIGVTALGIAVLLRFDVVPVLPLFRELGFVPVTALMAFIAVTGVLRMLIEHFLLNMRYKKLDWIEILIITGLLLYLYVHSTQYQ